MTTIADNVEIGRSLAAAQVRSLTSNDLDLADPSARAAFLDVAKKAGVIRAAKCDDLKCDDFACGWF